MDSLNLKRGTIVLASITTVNEHNNKPIIPILHENVVPFAGSQNGDIYFETVNHSEFDLTTDILNTNKDKINKPDLLRPFEMIKIAIMKRWAVTWFWKSTLLTRENTSCSEMKDLGASELLTFSARRPFKL
jgi:hypothetical protein